MGPLLYALVAVGYAYFARALWRAGHDPRRDRGAEPRRQEAPACTTSSSAA
jgi:hypothetical protein